MRSHAPFKPIVNEFCVWGQVGDVITDAKFYGNRLRGFGVTGPPQTPFPILNVHRLYNSVSTTVLHCNRVDAPKHNYVVVCTSKNKHRDIKTVIFNDAFKKRQTAHKLSLGLKQQQVAHRDLFHTHTASKLIAETDDTNL